MCRVRIAQAVGSSGVRVTSQMSDLKIQGPALCVQWVFGEDVLTLLCFTLGKTCLIWTCGQSIITRKVLTCVCERTPFDTLQMDHAWPLW